MFANSNGRQFQKGLDHAAARANRHNATLSLRRQQREEHLQKKVRLLSSCSKNRNNSHSECHEERAYKCNIPKYVANIMQTDCESLQLKGLISIRKLLSVERDLPTNRIISSGVIPRIIQFMFENNYRLAFESAWTITNIAATSDNQSFLSVIKYGAINAFIHLLKNSSNFPNNIEIITQAIWGLGNISGDNFNEKQFGNIIIDSGICSHIISILLSNDCQLHIDLFNIGMWAIHNYLKVMEFDNNLTFEIFNKKYNNLYKLICKILSECHDSQILSDTLWCLCALTNNINDDNLLNKILFPSNTCNNPNNIINLCMKLLNLEIGKYEIALSNNKTIKEAILTLNYKIYKPVLRFLGNICTSNDSITQTVIECGYLDCIQPFLNHFLMGERREILWTISNICAGTQQQIEYILSREKLIHKIIDFAINDKICVRFEAIMCICNIAFEAIPSQKKQLAEIGGINALCQLLNTINNINDKQIITVCEGLNEFLKTFSHTKIKYSNPFANMIEECNGLNYLENRCADESINQNTYNVIVNLMKKYWDENCENENICLTQNNNHNNNINIDKKTNQFKFGLNNNNNKNHQTFAF